jgi:hypothetical protein
MKFILTRILLYSTFVILKIFKISSIFMYRTFGFTMLFETSEGGALLNLDLLPFARTFAGKVLIVTLGC